MCGLTMFRRIPSNKHSLDCSDPMELQECVLYNRNPFEQDTTSSQNHYTHCSASFVSMTQVIGQALYSSTPTALNHSSTQYPDNPCTALVYTKISSCYRTSPRTNQHATLHTKTGKTPVSRWTTRRINEQGW